MMVPDIPPARVSRGELERRWGLIRSAMEAEGIHLLFGQANNERYGGYVRYLTDIDTHKSMVSVLFPREGGSIVTLSGPPDDVMVDPRLDEPWRGVARVVSTPSFMSVGYTGEAESRIMLEALAGYETATVGLLGTRIIAASTVDAIRRAYPKMRLVDASGVVDCARAVKSAEEQALIRSTGAQQDATMTALFDEIQTGMRRRDVAVKANAIAQALGSVTGQIKTHVSDGREYTAGFVTHDDGRPLVTGDVVSVLVETDGPSGFYTHMVRTLSLGPVPDAFAEEYIFTLSAQEFAVDLLRPDARPSDVWTEYNEFMRDNGRPEEQRLHCHGQGYDMTERPLIRPEETMLIAAGMNFGCHPAYKHGAFHMWTCANYIVGRSGAEPVNLMSTRVVER